MKRIQVIIDPESVSGEFLHAIRRLQEDVVISHGTSSFSVKALPSQEEVRVNESKNEANDCIVILVRGYWYLVKSREGTSFYNHELVKCFCYRTSKERRKNEAKSEDKRSEGLSDI